MYYPVFLNLEIVLYIFCYHQVGVICLLMPVLTLPCRLLLLGPVLLTDPIYDWDPQPQKIHEHRFIGTSSTSEPKKAACSRKALYPKRLKTFQGE